MPRAPQIVAEARKRKVAANMLSPKPEPAAKLAKRIGVKASTVRDLQHDPEVKAIAKGMLEPHRAQLAGLLPKSIAVIAKALGATDCFNKADHGTRLKAVDRLRRMVELIDRYDDAIPDNSLVTGFRGTLEELLIEYRAVTLRTAPGKDGERVTPRVTPGARK